MKFPQLPIGSRFEYEGVEYVKSGPLTANAIAGGQARMIKRSAIVTPLDAVAPARATGPQGTLEREKVAEALAAYQSAVEQLLAEAGAEAPCEALGKPLQHAYAELRQRLGL